MSRITSAMAQKPPTTPKKSTSWGTWAFTEPKSFSWTTLAAVIAILTALVLLQSLLLNQNKCLSNSVHTLSTIVAHPQPYPLHKPVSPPHPTELSRVVFAIAGAAKNWHNRRNYIKRWYHQRNNTRAIVWLDQAVNGTWDSDAPPFKISEDISRYPFNMRRRTATRIARAVAETVRLGLVDVDWFVMGDDDTFFLVDNVVHVLSKYDPAGLYYVGGSSETHAQNLLFGFNMAFGGGGFAISFALASLLANMQDACLARYPDLFGSDERIFVCMTELGIPLTRELGFHQMDIRGNAMGMLAAHPQTPLVSIHHMDIIQPIFPGLSKYASIDHLLEATKVESASVFQQSMCYAPSQKWSFSVSWGYVVQVYKGFLPPRDLETPLRTFSSIKRGNGNAEFPFNTREIPKETCKRPSMFYMKSVHGPSNNSQDLLESLYLRNEDLKVTRPSCDGELKPLTTVRRIRVVKKPVSNSWLQAPRRSCCTVSSWSEDSVELQLHDCQAGETLLTSSLH